MKTHARIELGGADEDSRVLLNGADLAGATSAIELTADPRGATLTLTVPLYEFVAEGNVRVEVPHSTWEALVALGWTPPSEGLDR